MCGVFGVCVIKMYKQRRYREREMKAVKLQQLEFLLLYFQATTKSVQGDTTGMPGASAIG